MTRLWTMIMQGTKPEELWAIAQAVFYAQIHDQAIPQKLLTVR